MYSQQTDFTKLDNMKCCPNYYLEKVPDQSWGVNQNNFTAKSESWPQSTQNQIISDKSYDSRQQNGYSVDPVTTKHQHASIADWEAYLYSPTASSVRNTEQNADCISNQLIQKKKHRAQITFVHTSNGVFKPIVKRKRKRTTFTTEQVETLEAIFYKRPYVSREERQVLMDKLQLTDKAIKVWFQNRRLKVKKEREEQEMESSDSEAHDFQDIPLAYVEAQMCKADEFGYVTLDERAVSELVNVIDVFLPHDADLGYTDLGRTDTTRLCSVSESESSAMYEPISPPDLSDSTSQDTFAPKWQFEAIDSKKSFQNLLDVHMYERKEENVFVF